MKHHILPVAPVALIALVLALALGVLCPADTVAADGIHPLALPHVLLAPIDAVDPAIREDMTWTAWPAGRPELRQPLLLEPSSHDGWLIATVTAPAAAAESWVLLGTAHGRAFSLLARSGAMPAAAQEILPPGIVALAEPGRVALSWSPASAPALSGWRLERSETGTSWSAMATLAPDASSAEHAADSGIWTYRVVPVLLGDVIPEMPIPGSEPVRATDGDRDGDGVPDEADACDVAPGADCSWSWADVAPAGRPDGIVNVADVVRILRFSVGTEIPTEQERLAANVAPALVAGHVAHPHALAPHAVDVGDAVLALRVSVGLMSLPQPR